MLFKSKLLPAASCGILLALSAAGAFADDTRTVSTYKENVTVERTTTVQEVVVQHRQKQERYKCAIFVTNRAERVGDNKVSQIQDFLTGYITDKGFDVVAREDVLNAVSNLSSAGPNKGDSALAGADRDKLLSNNTSAQRLAQNLDCDYVLMISIASYGVDTQRYHGNGMDLVSKTYQLRAGYKVLDGTSGASITAGNSVVKTIDRIDPRNGSSERENVVDDLLDGAAADMAGMLDHAVNRGAIRQAQAAPDEVAFGVNVSIANLVVPAIVRDDNGRYAASPESYPIDTTASVEVDGVMVGTSGSSLKAKPGLHKLRLFRAMLQDYEATVKISQGMLLDVKMEMSNDGRAEFRQMAAFMNEVRHAQQLTDGQVKVLEGYAQKLSQSGMRVEIRDPAKHPVDVGMWDADNDAVMRTRNSAGSTAAPGEMKSTSAVPASGTPALMTQPEPSTVQSNSPVTPPVNILPPATRTPSKPAPAAEVAPAAVPPPGAPPTPTAPMTAPPLYPPNVDAPPPSDTTGPQSAAPTAAPSTAPSLLSRILKGLK